MASQEVALCGAGLEGAAVPGVGCREEVKAAAEVPEVAEVALATGVEDLVVVEGLAEVEEVEQAGVEARVYKKTYLCFQHGVGWIFATRSVAECSRCPRDNSGRNGTGADLRSRHCQCEKKFTLRTAYRASNHQNSIARSPDSNFSMKVTILSHRSCTAASELLFRLCPAPGTTPS